MVRETAMVSAIIIVMTFGISTVSQAQPANTGAVVGSVTDSSGAVVVNVRLEIVSEATSSRRRGFGASFKDRLFAGQVNWGAG